MSVENLKDAPPEYAKDLKLNLGSITRTTLFNEEQLWGTLLASAAATRNTQVLQEKRDPTTTPARVPLLTAQCKTTFI